MPALRAAPNVVVADGQSLNTSPGGSDNWINKLQGTHLPSLTIYNAAAGGASWTSLAAQTFTARVSQFSNCATQSCLVMVGGQFDLLFENDTGATLYADMVSYANTARSAGYDFVVATTIPPSTEYNATRDGRRVDCNALIMADASGAFDAEVNLAAVSGLDDPNSAYYFDGLHWNATGTTLVASTLASPIGALLGISA